MRLLIVTPIFPPQIGGPASYVSGLFKRLQKQHQVKVVTFSESKTSIQKGVFAVSTDGTMLSRQIKLLLQLFKAAQMSQILYAQGTIVVGVSSLIVATLRNIPLVIKFVGDEVWESLAEAGKTTESLNAFYARNHAASPILWLHRLVLRKASRIIVPSNYLKDFLVTAHGIHASKIRVIPNAVEIPSKLITKPQKSPHTLVFVGRMVPWKHVDQIIKAVSLARKTKPWQLRIVGDGVERRNLEDLVNKLHAESWVTFMGKLSKSQTLQEIATAERLMLYSTYEGQPHTLIEALLLETPIIASNIPPHQELLGNNNVVQPNNPEALAQAINNEHREVQALANPMDFSWHNHIVKLEKELKELL
jgi:glycosyltransferase involved in cell wall biosynthesis